MHHITKNQVKFSYPPFVDGTYDQVIALIREVFSHGIIKNKEYEQLFIGDVFALKDKEEKPIKYMKKWAIAKASNTQGECLFTIPFLNMIDDNAKLSEQEMADLVKRVEAVFEENGFEYEKCPFPLSEADVLKGKKSIINRLYYEEAKVSYPYGVITNDLIHTKRT